MQLRKTKARSGLVSERSSAVTYSRKKPLLSQRLCHFEARIGYFTTFTKIIRNVNSTRDSMNASPTNKAI